MEIINILGSLNKISLVAFLFTFIFLTYQFFLLKKEVGNKKNKPIIPDFNENMTTFSHETKVLAVKKNTSYKKSSKTTIIISIFLLLIFGTVFLLGIINSKTLLNQEEKVISPTPIINLVASKGIKIYNQNWVELTNKELLGLQPGKTIIIGIESIKNTDVDKARIRINKKSWDETDMAVKFNTDKNIFYREYNISSQEARLNIEAQLHSQADGWLGQ